jgi:hypothetical protein
MDKFDLLRKERKRLRELHVELFEAVSKILFEYDPIEINFETNTDEYEPEVGTILPRLRACKSEADARRAIHEEFVHWFGADIAGPEEKYADIASAVWETWVRLRGDRFIG